MNIKNLYLGIKDQLPLKRLFRNLFITGNAKGLFHKRSHYKIDGQEKISYSKASAIKASEKMTIKYKKDYTVYKCIFCDGYHIGANR